MKTFKIKLTFLALMFSISSFSQNFNDRIYTTEGDSIVCSITKYEKGWFYYDCQGKKGVKNKYIHSDDIKYYIQNGKVKGLHVHKYAKSSYSEVVLVDSTITRNELFSAIMSWYAKHYVSAQNVIQYQDKEEGKIVGKGRFDVFSKGESMRSDFGFVNHTISILIKDGKYKYTIDNLTYSSNERYLTKGYDIGNAEADKWYPQKVWNGVREMAYFEIQEIIISLKEAANNAKKSSDW